METATFRALGTVLCIGLLGAAGAAAQDLSSADARTAAYRQIGRACATDTVRFCPAIDPKSGATHDQVLCLKPYRADLSPPCRKAVAAATARTPDLP
jgi:hypothetical protein